MRGALLVVAVLMAGCPLPPTHPDFSRCTPGYPKCPLGAACQSSKDCNTDAGIQCTRGACMVPCASDGGCGAGQTCGQIDGHGWCMVGCANEVCPGGAGCKTYWPTRQRVCAGAELGKACSSVNDTGLCSTCGLQYFTTTCEDTGEICPGKSQCLPITSQYRCDCFGQQTYNCDGTPCDPMSCVPPFYHCNSQTLAQTTCLDEPREFSATCRCADGRELPVACGETSACEHRCAQGCSLLAQDCPDPHAPKCTYLRNVPVPTEPGILAHDRTVCVPLTGSKGLGEACSRTVLEDGGTEVGRDDCAKGLVCEPVGAPRGEMRCWRVCTQTVECGDGGVCARTVVTFPPSGYCVSGAGCTIGGTGCGAGKSCSFVRNVDRERTAYCKVDGPGAVDAPCTTNADCGANLVCGNTCRPTCSTSYPCTTGVCDEDGGLPGVCL